MEENGAYAALITINSCFVVLMITIIFIRKTFFQERLDELEIGITIASEDFKSNLKGFYGGKGSDTINESFMDTRREFIKIMHITGGLEEGEIKAEDVLKSLINNFLFLKDPRSYKSENLSSTSIKKTEALKLLHEINEINNRIPVLISIIKELENQNENENKKLENLNSFIENSKEEHLKNKDKILSIIRLHEEKENFERRYKETNSNKAILFISYQCTIGIFIPLFLISTLHYNECSMHLFYTYDCSIFVGLSLITASILPYVYIIGRELAQLKTHI